jgi:hypothetical protein
MKIETRFSLLVQSDDARAESILKFWNEDAKSRWSFYSQLTAMHYNSTGEQKSFSKWGGRVNCPSLFYK